MIGFNALMLDSVPYDPWCYVTSCSMPWDIVPCLSYDVVDWDLIASNKLCQKTKLKGDS